MTTFDHEAFWSARYRDAGDDYLFGTAPNKFLATQIAWFGPEMSILSVADGEGRNSVWLAEQGCRVTAVELSSVGREKAGKLARARNVVVDLREADILRWDWPESAYDAVVGIFIQFATPAERPRQLAGMKQAVKPGGLLLLQGYSREQIAHGTGGPSAVENLYTLAMLQELFADWEILHLVAHEDFIEEGQAHAGRSALIDLVAKKP